MPVRPRDWLVYAVLAAMILSFALASRDMTMAPPAPPPSPGLGQIPIDPASPFANLPVANVSPWRMREGRTAASVGAQGRWLTAAAGLRCKALGVVVAGGRATPVRASLNGHSLLVLTSGAGAPSPPLARGDPRSGDPGFFVGFPRGGPGEVAARFVGRRQAPAATEVLPGGPLLAWAVSGHTQELAGGWPGLIGAPVFDAAGEMVGITIGQSPRRGLIYTTTPERTRLAAAGGPGPAAPIGADNYGRAADTLRRALSVAQVVCLDR